MGRNVVIDQIEVDCNCSCHSDSHIMHMTPPCCSKLPARHWANCKCANCEFTNSKIKMIKDLMDRAIDDLAEKAFEPAIGEYEENYRNRW